MIKMWLHKWISFNYMTLMKGHHLRKEFLRIFARKSGLKCTLFVQGKTKPILNSQGTNNTSEKDASTYGCWLAKLPHLNICLTSGFKDCC